EPLAWTQPAFVYRPGAEKERRFRWGRFTKVECIRATVEILRLPLADAKRIVHESRAWADRREDGDRFHEVLEAEFRAEASGG
ncbi:MAG: hypothetical protein QOD57_2389, partial [Actinomycetota bacterium]|nr:hypothetical protein [Actinomycetota bacterium]